MELIYIKTPAEMGVDPEGFYSFNWDYSEFYPDELVQFAGTYVECEICGGAMGSTDFNIKNPRTGELFVARLRNNWFSSIESMNRPETARPQSCGVSVNPQQHQWVRVPDIAEIATEPDSSLTGLDYFSFNPFTVFSVIFDEDDESYNQLLDNLSDVKIDMNIVEESRLIRLSEQDTYCGESVMLTLVEFLSLEIPYGTGVRLYLRDENYDFIVCGNLQTHEEFLVITKSKDQLSGLVGMPVRMSYYTNNIERDRRAPYVPGAVIVATLVERRGEYSGYRQYTHEDFVRYMTGESQPFELTLGASLSF